MTFELFHVDTKTLFNKSYRMFDPTVVNPVTVARLVINERYQAVVENQDGGYDSC